MNDAPLVKQVAHVGVRFYRAGGLELALVPLLETIIGERIPKKLALQQNLWGGIGRRTGQRLDFLRHSSGVQ